MGRVLKGVVLVLLLATIARGQESLTPSESPSFAPSVVSQAPSVVTEAPTPSSTGESSEPPSSSPTQGATTNPPTSLATTEVPTSPPSQIPATENPTTRQPSDRPSSIPSQVDTLAPSDRPSDVPSQSPTNVLTTAPSSIPTASPSYMPSDMPSSTPTEVTAVPTSAPSQMPSKYQGQRIGDTFKMISMPLVNVGTLNENQLDVFFAGTLVREFTKAYNAPSRVRRRLQLSDDITNVETVVEEVAQDAQPGVNTLTYTQGVSYINTTATPPTPREVIDGFFDFETTNRLFVEALKTDPSFENMPATVEITIPQDGGGGGDSGGLSGGAIAGIAVGGAVGALLIGMGGYKMMAGKHDGPYRQTSSQPPNQFNLNESGEVSTMQPSGDAAAGAGPSEELQEVVMAEAVATERLHYKSQGQSRISEREEVVIADAVPVPTSLDG